MTLHELEERYGKTWHIVPLHYGAAAWRHNPANMGSFSEGWLYSLVGLDFDDLAEQLARQPDSQKQHPQAPVVHRALAPASSAFNG